MAIWAFSGSLGLMGLITFSTTPGRVTAGLSLSMFLSSVGLFTSHLLSGARHIEAHNFNPVSNVRAAHASRACASDGVAHSGVVKIARGRCGRVLRERLNRRTAARHRSVSAAKLGGVFSRDVVLQLLNGHFLLRDDPLY